MISELFQIQTHESILVGILPIDGIRCVIKLYIGFDRGSMKIVFDIRDIIRMHDLRRLLVHQLQRVYASVLTRMPVAMSSPTFVTFPPAPSPARTINGLCLHSTQVGP